MQDINFPKPLLHFFICVNDRTSKPGSMPSCGPTITEEMVKEVKAWIREQGWVGVVQATKVSCLGFCNEEGGVLCVYPQGRFVKGLQTVGEIKQIVLEEVGKVGL